MRYPHLLELERFEWWSSKLWEQHHPGRAGSWVADTLVGARQKTSWERAHFPFSSFFLWKLSKIYVACKHSPFLPLKQKQCFQTHTKKICWHLWKWPLAFRIRWVLNPREQCDLQSIIVHFIQFVGQICHLRSNCFSEQVAEFFLCCCSLFKRLLCG